MDEAQGFVVDALGHPAEHARAVAIDAVPHHLLDEAADLGEAGPPVELGHAHRHLVATHFRDEGTGARMDEPGFAGGRAETRLGFHSPDQSLEIPGRQDQIEIQLAHVLEIAGSDARVADVEGFDDATTDTAMSPVRSPDQPDVGKPAGVLLDNLGRAIRRPIVDNHPQCGRQRLLGDTLNRLAGVLGFVTARRDQAVAPIALIRRRPAHARTPWR